MKNHNQQQGRVGVILPGGGAKGAYQAGSALYLAEWLNRSHRTVTAIAGASVGAINGAVLASAPNFLEGAQRLSQVWQAVGHLPPAELEIFRNLPGVDLGVLISLLLAAGASTPIDRLLGEIGAAALMMKQQKGNSWLFDIAAAVLDFRPVIAANPTLRDYLEQATSVNGLRNGIPFYVSVYPTQGVVQDVARVALANLTGIDTQHSHLLHVQSLPAAQQHDAILGSAAIPFIFDAKQILGQHYVDGVLGGWRTQQGQVPARELCDRETIDALFVLHCSDGSLWDRRGTLLPPTIEIRPTQALSTGNIVHDYIHADSETIQERLEQGYRDAERCIAQVSTVMESMARSIEAKVTLADAMKGIDD